MSKFISTLAMLVGAWLMSAWLLMLGIGVVHAEWLPQIPTIGFTLALLLASFGLGRAAFASVLGQILKAIEKEHR